MKNSLNPPVKPRDDNHKSQVAYRGLTAGSGSGFTLLEVILSIALLTTIVMLTINVLSSELFLRQKIIDRYPFDKVINRIAQDISGAFILPDLPQDKQINFVHAKINDNSTLLFSVLNHQSLISNTKESNLARIGYIVENKDDKNQLIRIVDTQMEEWKYIPTVDVGVRTVLAPDIKEFQLKFWKKTKFEDTWDSTTNESGRLPKMVKIILTLYGPNNTKGNISKKQEIHLEEIVYVRNSIANKKTADDEEPEEYSWQ